MRDREVHVKEVATHTQIQRDRTIKGSYKGENLVKARLVQLPYKAERKDTERDVPGLGDHTLANPAFGTQ